MKYFKLAILTCLLGCNPKPEFTINGKQYYTRRYCVAEHSETVWDFHWGFNIFSGEYEYHFGPHTKTTCLQYQIDTIEIIDK